MPLPLSDAAAELVAARLQDGYLPVQGSACDLANRSKSARFRQPLIDVLRTTSNHWVLRSAFQAAAACGADMDRLLELLVGRLERHSNDRQHGFAQPDDRRGDRSGAVRPEPHDDWQSFLGDMQRAWRGVHRGQPAGVARGKRFKPGQPPLRRNVSAPVPVRSARKTTLAGLQDK